MPRQLGGLAFSFLLLTLPAQGMIVHPSATTNLNTVLITADQLATIQAALPQVTDPKLETIFHSPQTLWYDANVMSPSYQDSVGASANIHWPDLVAASEDVISGIHDRSKHRWQFPFGATAGTDDSTNLRVENFAFFPQTDGQVQTTMITTVIRNDNRPEWTWTYQTGTVFGEILFITDGANLLPVEIRTRTRNPAGWSMNVFRPFPQASDLAQGIQQLRPNWSTTPNLKAMIDFLGDNTTLKAASLTAKAGLSSTFSQDGYLDTLPDFGDDQLVRDLLTTRIFRSAYDTSWKENGAQKTYAPSTASALSIVPTNYTAGLIQVTDDACMRCHKETGRMVSDFYFDLYLYGEVWGKDGIFTFHPYDESLYPQLRVDGIDNRALNSKLAQAGIFRTAFNIKRQDSSSKAAQDSQSAGNAPATTFH